MNFIINKTPLVDSIKNLTLLQNKAIKIMNEIHQEQIEKDMEDNKKDTDEDIDDIEEDYI